MFEGTPEREFKPREQNRAPRVIPARSEQAVQQQFQSKGNINGIDKSVSMGVDPFNSKPDDGAEARIQGKLQLLHALRKELGQRG